MSWYYYEALAVAAVVGGLVYAFFEVRKFPEAVSWVKAKPTWSELEQRPHRSAAINDAPFARLVYEDDNVTVLRFLGADGVSDRLRIECWIPNHLQVDTPSKRFTHFSRSCAHYLPKEWLYFERRTSDDRTITTRAFFVERPSEERLKAILANDVSFHSTNYRT